MEIVCFYLQYLKTDKNFDIWEGCKTADVVTQSNGVNQSGVCVQ